MHIYTQVCVWQYVWWGGRVAGWQVGGWQVGGVMGWWGGRFVGWGGWQGGRQHGWHVGRVAVGWQAHVWVLLAGIDSYLPFSWKFQHKL
jgi:hypothetical protein